MTSSDIAAVHRRIVALVRHYRVLDMRTVGALVGELVNPDDAAAAIASLVQLVSWALDDHPADADEWLDAVEPALATTDTSLLRALPTPQEQQEW